MNRGEILDTAKEYVTKNRQDVHGSAEDNFNSIAVLWKAYLFSKYGKTVNFSAADIAWMMVLFKMARGMANPLHVDNYVDAAGYIACGGEIMTKTDKD